MAALTISNSNGPNLISNVDKEVEPIPDSSLRKATIQWTAPEGGADYYRVTLYRNRTPEDSLATKTVSGTTATFNFLPILGRYSLKIEIFKAIDMATPSQIVIDDIDKM